MYYAIRKTVYYSVLHVSREQIRGTAMPYLPDPQKSVPINKRLNDKRYAVLSTGVLIEIPDEELDLINEVLLSSVKKHRANKKQTDKPTQSDSQRKGAQLTQRDKRMARVYKPGEAVEGMLTDEGFVTHKDLLVAPKPTPPSLASTLRRSGKADPLPVEQGADAVRAFIQAKMVARGVGIDAWLDTLEEARTESTMGDGRKDHRTRMLAVQMEMGISGVSDRPSVREETKGTGQSINIHLSSEGGAMTEEFAAMNPKEQVAHILGRSRAILAGAKTEEDVAKYITETPPLEIPDEYMAAREEAETILEKYTPVLTFDGADIDSSEDE